MKTGIVLIEERTYKSNKFLYPINRTCPFAVSLVRESIDIITLNPNQVYHYYTLPFALYYDLKHYGGFFDYLVLDSRGSVHTFCRNYPDYWAEIQTHFSSIRYFADESAL